MERLANLSSPNDAMVVVGVKTANHLEVKVWRFKLSKGGTQHGQS